MKWSEVKVFDGMCVVQYHGFIVTQLYCMCVATKYVLLLLSNLLYVFWSLLCSN